jgi:hypothetical protein
VIRDEAPGAPERVERGSAEGALIVFFPSRNGAKRGTASKIPLTLKIKPGWHLQGPDGLRIEAWAGSDFTFEEVPPPAPSRLPGSTGSTETGWHGTFETNLSFSVSRKAAKGRREVSVRVIHRACGEGACRPEEVLSLTVPVEVV